MKGAMRKVSEYEAHAEENMRPTRRNAGAWLIK